MVPRPSHAEEAKIGPLQSSERTAKRRTHTTTEIKPFLHQDHAWHDETNAALGK